jgi:hypothetical protein
VGPWRNGLLLQPEQADASSRHPASAGVLGRLETDGHVGLGAQVVDLVRLHLLEDAGQVGTVGQVAVMQHEALVLDVGILVDVIYPLGIQRRGPALDAMDFVTLFEEERSRSRPVRYAGYECWCCSWGYILSGKIEVDA